MINGITNFEAFLITSVLLVLTPGADTLYTLGRSINGGRKAGIFAALGSGTGLVIHSLFATFGLSVLLANSAVAFTIVKYLGGLYLIYLGIKSLRTNRQQLKEVEFKKKVSYRKVYLSGVITNILNPKVALFFLAFLPQFITIGYINNWIPLLVLGVVFSFLGTLWCLIVAISASKLAHIFTKNDTIQKWLDRIAGSIFIILGIKIAISNKQ